MYRVGVVGDKDSVLGFTAIGLEAYPTADAQEAETIIRRLADSEFAVIYITEQLAADLGPFLAQYRSRRFPAIIPVPGVRGSLGIGMAGVHQCVEKAVGADILSND